METELPLNIVVLLSGSLLSIVKQGRIIKIRKANAVVFYIKIILRELIFNVSLVDFCF